MTLDVILTCFCLATKGSSLKSMIKKTKAKGQKISYNSLTDFFQEPWQPEFELRSAAEGLFNLQKGWLVLDEIVLAKSKESLVMASVKRRKKSAGGYITPSVSLVLLLWCDGKQRVPIGLAYRHNQSVQDLAIQLLSQARNGYRLKPLCVLFDAGFFSSKLIERITSYGWMFVCKAPKTILFEAKRIWQFKRQGFWNDQGYLKCGLKVRAVSEEVFKILKQCCHWDYCQLRIEAALSRFYVVGLLTFMTWEHKRNQALSSCTIYEMRSDVLMPFGYMYGDQKPPISHYFLHREVA